MLGLYIMIIICITPCLNILIHELGHLIMGLYLGYNFISLKILGLIVYKTDKLRVRYVGIGYTYGQVCMCTKDNQNYNRLYDLGGILGQLVLLVLYISMWNILGLIGAVITLLIILMNLYPISKSGVITDGYFYFKCTDKDREVLKSNLHIYLEHTYKSYKDIDSKLYNIDSDGVSVLDTQNIYLGVICKYVINKEYEKAMHHLEKLYKRLSGYDTIFMLEVLSDLYSLYVLTGNITKMQDREIKLLQKNSKKLVNCARFVYLYTNNIKRYNKLYNKLVYQSEKEYEDSFIDN